LRAIREPRRCRSSCTSGLTIGSVSHSQRSQTNSQIQRLKDSFVPFAEEAG
jgi:hypothetical protein